MREHSSGIHECHWPGLIASHQLRDIWHQHCCGSYSNLADFMLPELCWTMQLLTSHIARHGKSFCWTPVWDQHSDAADESEHLVISGWGRWRRGRAAGMPQETHLTASGQSREAQHSEDYLTTVTCAGWPGEVVTSRLLATRTIFPKCVLRRSFCTAWTLTGAHRASCNPSALS